MQKPAFRSSITPIFVIGSEDTAIAQAWTPPPLILESNCGYHLTPLKDLQLIKPDWESIDAPFNLRRRAGFNQARVELEKMLKGITQES